MPFISEDNPISLLPESYWAFFSFVPKDLPWCDWLYFTLHGYPVPAALAVRATRFGFPLPDHISAFPDPNDPSHRENMDAALNQVRWLVVVVSPHSAHDPQIDEHIRAFKNAGGEERIIALVVEGEPPSTSTLYVKSENRDWLPRWLQWRLGDDGRFKAADPSEPLIIDARPGYSSLDDVMTTLISVLLDVPREELELLEALTQDDGEVAKASVLSARAKMVAAAMADFEEDAPSRGSAKSTPAQASRTESVRRPGILLSIGGGLILATIAAVVAFRNVDRDTPSKPVVLAAAPAPATEISEPPMLDRTSSPEVGSSRVEIPPMVAERESASTPAQVPPAEQAVSVMDHDPATVVTQAEPAPPPVEVPPDPAERERGVSLALEATTSKAEALLERGAYEEAADAFEEAIAFAQKLAGMRGGDGAISLQIAQLCRTLGALQMRVASDAEAQLTLERGLKALGKVKGGKELVRERSRLKVEMDAVLRRLKSGSTD